MVHMSEGGLCTPPLMQMSRGVLDASLGVVPDMAAHLGLWASTQCYVNNPLLRQPTSPSPPRMVQHHATITERSGTAEDIWIPPPVHSLFRGLSFELGRARVALTHPIQNLLFKVAMTPRPAPSYVNCACDSAKCKKGGFFFLKMAATKNSLATTPTTRFYGGGRRSKTAAGRLLNPTCSNSNWSPATPLGGRRLTPSTPQSHFMPTPIAVPHFQPGESLQDRSDLYSEAGSESDDGLDIPLSGSTVHNSGRDVTRINHPDLSLLVQQQQGMLLKIIQQQETLKENQTQYAERLDVIESALSKITSDNAEQNSKQQERSRLPKGLGVS